MPEKLSIEGTIMLLKLSSQCAMMDCSYKKNAEENFKIFLELFYVVFQEKEEVGNQLINVKF